mgnify:CR=1 FL=1
MHRIHVLGLERAGERLEAQLLHEPVRALRLQKMAPGVRGEPTFHGRGLRWGEGDVQGSDRCGDADGRASSDLLRGRVPVRVPLRVNSDLLKRGCDGPDTVNWKLNLEVAGVHLLRTYISTIRRCK